MCTGSIPGDSGEPPQDRVDAARGDHRRSRCSSRFRNGCRLARLMDFGYEDEVAFPVTIAAAATMKPGPVHLDAQVSWLVCAQVCIPGKAHLGIDLTVQPGAKQGPLVGALGEALSLIPKPLPEGAKFTVTGGAQQFALTLIDDKREEHAEFYPYPAEALRTRPATRCDGERSGAEDRTAARWRASGCAAFARRSQPCPQRCTESSSSPTQWRTR